MKTIGATCPDFHTSPRMAKIGSIQHADIAAWTREKVVVVRGIVGFVLVLSIGCGTSPAPVPSGKTLTPKASKQAKAPQGPIGDPWFHWLLKTKPATKEIDTEAPKLTDAGLIPISRLKHLESLAIRGSQITDAGLKHLAGLTRLRTLHLDGANISSKGLKHLKALVQVENLSLSATRVDDILDITSMKRLRILNLEGTQVDGTVVEDIIDSFKSLKVLDLRNTAVEPQDVSEMDEKMPDCLVHVDEPGEGRSEDGDESD